MTEEVKELLKQQKEIEENDKYIYGLALDGTDRVYYIIWKNILRSWKNTGIARESVRIILAKSVTFDDYYEDGYYDEEDAELVRLARSFSSRNNEKISFIFVKDTYGEDSEEETIEIMKPVITRILMGKLRDDGLTVSKHGSRLTVSATNDKLKTIAGEIDDKGTAYRKQY